MASANSSEEIREGFLCPLCMKDLVTIGQLQFHFETVHSNEDKAVFHSIKGIFLLSFHVFNLFGKAKKKILNLDFNDGFEATPTNDNSFSDFQFVNYEVPQELGATSSHTDYFKEIRSSRLDRYVFETNKLLIRLDKLISDAPLDPATRKNYEKSVVYWVSDNDVRLCPGCGRRFNIGRRRHHCRLCGSIMCSHCSDFILFTKAKKLTSPVLMAQQSVSQPTSPIHRSGSNSSLNSLVNAAGEPHIRVCIQCNILLDKRADVIEAKLNQPPIVQLYERLKMCIDETEKLCPIYTKMADSLNVGETNYNLRDAQDLRIKLIRLSENIDLLSKRIIGLGKDNPEADPMSILIQKSIRSRASNFLTENVIGLPGLPTDDLFAELQNKRSELIKKKIAQEKKTALEFHQKLQLEESPKREVKPIKPQTPDFGWGPETESVSSSNLDPMLQQIDNIRNFIRQARAAHLYDEVQILENNLRELETEYYNQPKPSFVGSWMR
uniref:FYVE-type domain-containing protein n=1 Tax=Strigamia maritima TaxID=126957 RepID=T1J0G3_STRMM